MNHDADLPVRMPYGSPRAVSASGLPAQGVDSLPGSWTEASQHPGSAINALRTTLLTLVRRDGRDLTARQLTAFMTVYLDSQVHTVSSMADLLNISRPGVTRILDRLAEYDLVERQEDRDDRRRVLIRRTPRGAAFLRELEEIAAGSMRPA